MPQATYEVVIPGLVPLARGKVREVYDLGRELLIVASDRVSAFDSVMPTPIPHKGRVLTSLSRFWFRKLRPFVVTHYITTDIQYIADALQSAGVSVGPDLAASLEGRSMLAVRAEMLPVECVVRGYLAGSLWAEYRSAGGPERAVEIHGIHLPAGLRESDQLPEPLFTPATKAETGHDENISFDAMARLIGKDLAEQVRRVSTTVYMEAARLARERGVIIADTKFEFGLHNGVLTLADEVLTPDSSRFWDAATYAPGKPQESFDKQYLRDWLVESGWNKEPPAPALPEDVVKGTTNRYLEAYRRITGHELLGGG